jgi:ectoine hydroxylase-related dioxygenase (phytanoyl-CoA dioxygenase family)
MDILSALKETGVTESTLSQKEMDILDIDGYIVFPNLIDPIWLEELRYLFDKNIQKEGVNAGKEVHQEKGARRLADMVNKGTAFDKIYTHPKVLAAVYHVIGREFKLSSLNGRDALQGEGLQGLHADWTGLGPDEPFHVCNSIWVLDDFKKENGATRVVPGTHRKSGKVSDYVADTLADHPDQELLIVPAGTVAVFNSHVWHGGTTNGTGEKRRAIHGYYCAREHEQQLDQSEYLRQITYERITPAARYILDVR